MAPARCGKPVPISCLPAKPPSKSSSESRSMRERTLVAVGERGAARLAPGSALEDALVAQIDWDATLADCAAALQPLLSGKGAVDVVLDDRMVRYFVMMPPEGTA